MNLTVAEKLELATLNRKWAFSGLTVVENQRRIVLGMQHAFSPAARESERRFVDSNVDR